MNRSRSSTCDLLVLVFLLLYKYLPEYNAAIVRIKRKVCYTLFLETGKFDPGRVAILPDPAFS